METKVSLFSSKKTLNLRGILWDLSRPRVMGILNMTPDSFYDGGRFRSRENLYQRIEEMVAEGADIIDIGGYSSRPGALHIPMEEERSRVLKALAVLHDIDPRFPASVDTFRASVAQAAVDAGAQMINDISGGSLDPHMYATAARLQVPYILMHMRGTPADMATQTDYANVVTEVTDYFVNRITKLLEAGVKDIIADPGFGFAKTRDQNYELLRNLNYFKVLNRPLLVGLSRKSLIYKPLQSTADEALTGTIALNTIALMNGASILRVHDIKAARETVQLFKLTYP